MGLRTQAPRSHGAVWRRGPMAQYGAAVPRRSTAPQSHGAVWRRVPMAQYGAAVLASAHSMAHKTARSRLRARCRPPCAAQSGRPGEATAREPGPDKGPLAGGRVGTP